MPVAVGGTRFNYSEASRESRGHWERRRRWWWWFVSRRSYRKNDNGPLIYLHLPCGQMRFLNAKKLVEVIVVWMMKREMEQDIIYGFILTGERKVMT